MPYFGDHLLLSHSVSTSAILPWSSISEAPLHPVMIRLSYLIRLASTFKLWKRQGLLSTSFIFLHIWCRDLLFANYHCKNHHLVVSFILESESCWLFWVSGTSSWEFFATLLTMITLETVLSCSIWPFDQESLAGSSSSAFQHPHECCPLTLTLLVTHHLLFLFSATFEVY